MLLCSGLGIKTRSNFQIINFRRVHIVFNFPLIIGTVHLSIHSLKYWPKRYQIIRSYRKRTVRKMMKFCFLQGISKILKYLFLIFLKLRHCTVTQNGGVEALYCNSKCWGWSALTSSIRGLFPICYSDTISNFNKKKVQCLVMPKTHEQRVEN